MENVLLEKMKIAEEVAQANNSNIVLTGILPTVRKYDLRYLNQDFVSEKIIFEFLSLFAIIFFALVILFPFYIMLVTSFKTQSSLLFNPIDINVLSMLEIFGIFIPIPLIKYSILQDAEDIPNLIRLKIQLKNPIQ